MATNHLIVRENLSVVNFPLEIIDLRIRLQAPNSWKIVAETLLSKITGNYGILRIQVGPDFKYSQKMNQTQLTEDFLIDFVKFFRLGDVHSLREIITVTFICN